MTGLGGSGQKLFRPIRMWFRPHRWVAIRRPPCQYPGMAKKLSPTAQARREALSTLRRAAEAGLLPGAAPEGLELGQYAGFWVTPKGRVYAPSEQPETPLKRLDVIVDPCGCGDARGTCGLRFLSQVDWADVSTGSLSSAEWWRSSAGGYLAVVEAIAARH